ncbi:MAG: phasin family protein [Hyphomicrobiaceae bacterium]
MNDAFTRHAEQFFNVAKDARMPENIQTMMVDGVAKTRDAYEKASSAAKDQAKSVEEALLAGQASARTLGAKVVENATANTSAAFDAAHAMARAGSLPEAARIQAEFVQKQMATVGVQTRDFFELSARLTQQTMQVVSEVAAKSFDQMNKKA